MKNFCSKLFLSLFLTMITANAFCYVHMFGKKQRLVKWSSTTTTVNFSYNTQNSSGLTDGEVTQIITNSASQWNGKSAISVSVRETPVLNTKGVNDIYFSKDPTVFNGTFVAGVTLMQFKENTSEIQEADILLNDNLSFYWSAENYTFLGNVVTHEIGHALGLGHSLVSGSSMFYALSLGQSTVESDDNSGLFSLYPNASLNKSSISGKIIGSKSLIPIFGTHVQAYSKTTGNISAGSISDTDGSFKIMGLNPADTYYLYVGPTQNLGANSRYYRARTDFCEGSQSYRGSFFQSCDKSLTGHPQEISLNSRANLDVGNISVRCALDTPAEFLEAKTTGSNYEFISSLEINRPKSFVGYFTKNEVIQSTTENHFSIDLSQVDLSSYGSNHFVKVKIRTQPFYSPLGIDVTYKYDGTITPYSGVAHSVNADYFNSLDKTFFMPINQASWSSKKFEISLKPINLFSLFQGASIHNDLYFPGGIADHEQMYFYLVDLSIVESTMGNYREVMTYSNHIGDNSYCADAKNTYKLSDSYLNADNDNETRNYEKATSCGSIDLDGNGPGNSGMGFFIGLLFTVLLAKITSISLRHYPVKHVGKIA